MLLVGDTAGSLYALSFSPSKKEFARKWSYAAQGAIYSAVCVADDMAFFGSDGGALYALRATDPQWNNAEAIWTYQTEGQIKAAPAYSRGLVYFVSGDRRLYAVQAGTGLLRWQFLTGRGLPEGTGTADAVSARTIAAPVVASDKVYVARSRYLYAVSADSGLLRWRFTADGDIIGSPAVSDRRLVVATRGGRIYCLHANTGEELWRWQTVGGESFGAPPVATSDVVVVRSRWGTLYGLDLATGSARWLYKLKETPATGALQAGSLVGQPGAVAPGQPAPTTGAQPGEAPGPLGPGASRGEKKADSGMQLASRLQEPSTGAQYFQRRREGGLYAGGLSARTPTTTTTPGATPGLTPYTAAAAPTSALEALISPGPIISGQHLYVISNDNTLCAFGPEGADSAPPALMGAHIQVPGGDQYSYAYALAVVGPETNVAKPVTIDGQAPIYLSFYAYDEGSGVDPDSIRLTMSGKPVEFKFRPDDCTVWYIVKREGEMVFTGLENGTYDFVLTVADWLGNAVTRKVVVKVDHSVTPPSGVVPTPGAPTYRGGYATAVPGGATPAAAGLAAPTGPTAVQMGRGEKKE